MIGGVTGLKVFDAKKALNALEVSEKKNSSFFIELFLRFSFSNTVVGANSNRFTWNCENLRNLQEKEKIKQIIESLKVFNEKDLLPPNKVIDVFPYMAKVEIDQLNFDQIRGLKENKSPEEFLVFLEKNLRKNKQRMIWDVLGKIHLYSEHSLKQICEQRWFINYMVQNYTIVEVLIQSMKDELYNLEETQTILINVLKDITDQNGLVVQNQRYLDIITKIRNREKTDFQDLIVSKDYDVVVVVGCKNYYLRKELLCQKSVYFNELLQKDNSERVELKDIRPHLFDTLYNFMLTGALKIDKHQIAELLSANELLAIKDLTKKLELFLNENSKLYQVEQLLHFSTTYDLPNLKSFSEEKLISSERVNQFELFSESLILELDIARRHKLDEYRKGAIFKHVSDSLTCWLNSEGTKHVDQIEKYCFIAGYFDGKEFDELQQMLVLNLARVIEKDHYICSLWNDACKDLNSSRLLKIICCEFVKRKPLVALNIWNNIVPDELQDALDEGLFPRK